MQPVAAASAGGVDPDRRPVDAAKQPVMRPSPTMVMVLEGRVLAQRLESGLAELGLSIRKLGILGHLAASPGASLTEVARRAGITVASVHSIIAALTEAEIVNSGSGGGRGRSAQLQLTDHGGKVMAQAFSTIAELDRECFEQAPGGWPELGRMLARIADQQRARAVNTPL